MSANYVETFRSEQEVLDKIDELKVQGYSEEDMYVMARHKDELSLVRGRTDVDLESSEGNWMDKFKAFVTGDSPVREAFNRMGMEREDAERYYDDVNNGSILLYADKHYEGSSSASSSSTAYAHPDEREGIQSTGSDNSNYVDDNIAPPTGLEQDRTTRGTNFTNESTHTESGSDNGKNFEPSSRDKEKYGSATSGSDNGSNPMYNEKSPDTVDAGTPRNDIRPDQEGLTAQNESVDNGEWEDRSTGTSGTHSNKREDTVNVGNVEVDNRDVEKYEDDENRLWGGQNVEDAEADERNQHNHDVSSKDKNGDHDRDKSDPLLTKGSRENSVDDRRLFEEERVFRGKDRL
ncbi:general stress protein [Jeotgalibacillus sp. ET6]|uniref:general stress protein n=1 Tax=Jeotgalibacillus sp. ET6 TaxID=3037260 RepID=UPI0024184F18|nr:general stress protein [Jeotgalibacillus sp. ET6]MDG5472733.1 general stress protein [Jeotgalibacillus sp. ET6]